MTAQDIRNLRKCTYQLVEAEERGVLIRNLISKDIGFREEEEFRIKEDKKSKGGRNFDKEKLTIKLAMREKLKDNFKFEGSLRRQRTKLVRKIEDILGQKSKRMVIILRNVSA